LKQSVEEAKAQQKFKEEVEQVDKDTAETAIKVAMKMRPPNACEQVDPSRKQRSYKNDKELIAKGLVPMTKQVRDDVEYPEETYKFPIVLGEDATPEDDFGPVKKMIDQSLAENANASVVAYGQTGSGKTHTVSGAEKKKTGLAQSTIRHISEQGEEAGYTRVLLKCVMV
jgi:DNA replication protein DnaC